MTWHDLIDPSIIIGSVMWGFNQKGRIDNLESVLAEREKWLDEWKEDLMDRLIRIEDGIKDLNRAR